MYQTDGSSLFCLLGFTLLATKEFGIWLGFFFFSVCLGGHFCLFVIVVVVRAAAASLS